MPTMRNVDICPPVFVPLSDDQTERNIYKVHCKCAVYNPNTQSFETDFKKAPIRMCDRAYGIVVEDFLEKFEPDMDEIQQWYRDFSEKKRKIKEMVKDGDIKIDARQNTRR